MTHETSSPQQGAPQQNSPDAGVNAGKHSEAGCCGPAAGGKRKCSVTRWVLRGIAAVVVLIVLAVTLLVIFIDKVAKAGIEQGSTIAMGVNSVLDQARIALLAGEFELRKLQVDNPQGFASKQFLAMGRGQVNVGLGSLMSEKVEIPLLHVSDVELNLERKNGKSNYGVILENLKKLESKSQPGEKPAEPAEKQPGKKFVIRKVEMKNIKVHMDLLPLGGKATQVTVPLDSLELENVGEGDNGVQLAEVTATLVKAVLKGAIEKGGGVIPDEIGQELRGGLAKLKDVGKLGVQAAKELTDQAGKHLEAAGKAVGTAAKELQSKIGSEAGNAGAAVEKAGGKVIQDAGELLNKLGPKPKEAAPKPAESPAEAKPAEPKPAETTPAEPPAETKKLKDVGKQGVQAAKELTEQAGKHLETAGKAVGTAAKDLKNKTGELLNKLGPKANEAASKPAEPEAPPAK